MVESTKDPIQPHPIHWTDAKVARLWNYYATVPAFQDLYFSRVYGTAILRRSGIPFDAALRVLDFGAGNGDLWKHAKRLGAKWRYRPLEFSSASVITLTEEFIGDSQFEQPILAEEFPLSVSAAQFDAVLMVEVVEHLSDDHLTGSLAEAARLLKPGARLLITTPHNEDLSRESQFCPDCGCVFHRWQHQRTWTPATLSHAVEAHGFVTERVWVGHWDDASWYGWIFNRVAARLRNRPLRPHMLAVFRRA